MDKIVVMKKGRIVEIGSHEELLRKKRRICQIVLGTGGMVSRKNRTYISNFKTVAKQLSNSRNCICEEASFYATIRFRTSCGVETGLTGHLRNSMNWE